MTEFAVLLSHASEATRGPELVGPERFTSSVRAANAGHDMATAIGVVFTVVVRRADGWRTLWGATCAEALADGNPTGWKRWWR